MNAELSFEEWQTIRASVEREYCRAYSRAVKGKELAEFECDYCHKDTIERRPCEVCGAKAEAHHDNYNEPLNIRWLCFKHHREWHKKHENPELLEVKDVD